MFKLRLINTLSKTKEDFMPTKQEDVKMYACGITPYDYSHIGHGRYFIFVDTLVRTLKLIGYNVNYVRNLTDIDDKILTKAEKELGDFKKYPEITKKFISLFNEEMARLNCLIPTHEPKVTENINPIIEFISGLLEKKAAYIAGSDVYFDTLTFKKYGKFSGKNLDDLISGARVEVNKKKKNISDFVLWKGNSNGLFWESPWGHGRPGWHIECSALAKKYLGDSIDIHCGGMDLIFPHHENEIAQSEALTGKTFAKYWIHNAVLNINKEKMSKSIGNTLTLQQVFEKFDPMVLRFYFLQHQYCTPIDFDMEKLEASQKAYKKLIRNFKEESSDSSDAETEKINSKIIQEITEAICDNLNTPKVIGIIFENTREISSSAKLKNLVKSFLNNVFGLTLQSIEHKKEVTGEIQDMINLRNQARKNKDWKTSDDIRDKLISLGYNLEDKKTN
jgi:cysteinyl-tRNA synthetase